MVTEILAKLAKGAAAVLTKKVTTVEPDGAEVTKISPREGVKGAAWILGFLVAWHFLIQPVLAYHFPQYAFPVLDGGWIGGILLGL